jgi:hypothetical protein
MIIVDKIETWGFRHAIRGMRNPMNSWNRSDSYWDLDEGGFTIGENDLRLMRQLYNNGQTHRKYLRQIFVSMDITAPLYWWKEFDTYKVGTVSNSCSTMHKIAAKEFEMSDFSHDQLELTFYWLCLENVVHCLNVAREEFLKTKDKTYWWQMIQLLPSSYNQKRTVTMSYENVMNILDTRQNHKLDEWVEFCGILKTLPYITEIRGNQDGK